jgi:hypothetical protein
MDTIQRTSLLFSLFIVALLLLPAQPRLGRAQDATQLRPTRCVCSDGTTLLYDPTIHFVIQMMGWDNGDEQGCFRDCVYACGCDLSDGPCCYDCVIGETLITPAPVQLANQAPLVHQVMISPELPLVGEPVRLTVSASDPDGDQLSYTWLLDEVRQQVDHPELLLEQLPGGEYQVRVVVDDGRGGMSEGEVRFKVFQATWCDEAGFFYDEATLRAFYTGAPSLTMSREQLITEFVAVLRQYRDEGGRLSEGVQYFDTPYIAQSFDSGALPTGHEATLHQAAAELARTRGTKLTPGELFGLALRVNRGSVRDALVTSHAALYRDGAKLNAQFIADYLQPLRDPRGYSSEQTVAVWNAQQERWTYVSAAETASQDQQGVWYHLFGMAVLEFADRHSYTPFELIRQGAEYYKPQHTSPLRQHGFPNSELGGELANYAIALENQVRTNMRRAPDPDKQCINYTGAAIGAALAAELGRAAQPAPPTPSPGGSYPVRDVYMLMSPVSLELEGVGGERLSFDQATQQFGGNTAAAYIEPLVEDDGTWALLVIPYFEVRKLELEGTADSAATFAVADLATRQTQVFALTVAPGERFSYAPGSVLTTEAGTPLAPAVVVEMPREARLLNPLMLAAVGLAVLGLLGLTGALILLLRRRRTAQPVAVPVVAACPGCGAAARPGANFCSRCRRRLR